jgi:hypothetical protein
MNPRAQTLIERLPLHRRRHKKEGQRPEVHPTNHIWIHLEWPETQKPRVETESLT